MSHRHRLMVLLPLLACGLSLAVLFYHHRTEGSASWSLAPAFQVAGKVTKAVDHSVSRSLLISNEDEAALGDQLAARLAGATAPQDRRSIYLNALIAEATRWIETPFRYRVLIQTSAIPNAAALPGGILLVTSGLLETLSSEAELVAVLGHEIGHVEMKHCRDMAKFALAAEKIGNDRLGKLADQVVERLVRPSFSKTQEGFADEFAFALLLKSPYDPRALGEAFARLSRAKGTYALPSSPGQFQPIQDYLMSHPSLDLRATTYRNRGVLWWRQNQTQQRYVGVQNLRAMEPFHLHNQPPSPKEWVSNPTAHAK